MSKKPLREKTINISYSYFWYNPNDDDMNFYNYLLDKEFEYLHCEDKSAFDVNTMANHRFGTNGHIRRTQKRSREKINRRSGLLNKAEGY